MKRTYLAPVLVTALALAAAPVFAGNWGSKADYAKASANIVETATTAGSFTTLVAAVQAAGLVDTLQSDGPFTVFAPTDAAFAKLPAGTVESLLANPDQLRQILLYHVVAGKVTSDQVINLEKATTAQGSDIKIGVSEGTVMINNAKVTQADIETSNGVIHVIDTVILPAS